MKQGEFLDSQLPIQPLPPPHLPTHDGDPGCDFLAPFCGNPSERAITESEEKFLLLCACRAWRPESPEEAHHGTGLL